MRLSIVTINYNDAAGLRRTLDSVASQSLAHNRQQSPTIAASPIELEHIIIDGASTDNSVDVIRDYESSLANNRPSSPTIASSPIIVRWISEKDKGVYNAMNKGIKMATGDYIQILNSGDILASNTVIQQMSEAIHRLSSPTIANNRPQSPTIGTMPEILYGNMLKTKDGVHIYKDNCGRYNGTPESFLYFYRGTMNHDTAWIRRDLFIPSPTIANNSPQSPTIAHNRPCFGLYDEEMKICSDWKWYVDAIALGGVKPIYVNIDVTIFDMNGISESGGKNKALIQKERREYLEQVLPASVLRDYDEFAMPIEQYRRLKRYHLWGIVYFVERVLFKLEKWNIIKH